MHIAILSAGRSLRDTFDPHASFDARVAVNSAAEHFPCQFWSCGDAQTFDRVTPPPEVLEGGRLPTLFTLTDSDHWFQQRRQTRQRFEASRVLLWGEVSRQTHAPNDATQWSITAALMLAVYLGARRVTVFGHDLEHQDPGVITDISGHELAKRLDTRPRVIAAWRVVKRWAQEKGIDVNEVQPALCT